ncbi:unnamed protein product [Penicillium nalgiovense]|uniref:Uncharacterized protein n=3 Tax=Penicillium TaxID=5073 RepID=A0A9W4HSM5_PENNA|nr:uncharacterized protein N7489_004675 [Penicillium chrysogenum]KAJ5853039.1 hypothetical protein N7534_005582 [Penicillium rubens]CAG8019527.1 unnamed protein product [Penicillium nalgiovense]CAP87068.1 hypothetical protein PCH_Pc24g01600 [Penicillium rubens Wisconsin 54-1255]KAJ5244579.1 hypothetical protein N7489_004675 [Penicillium chrysogenum]KZN87794.1 hypothetical protein EN45_063550 [Penicillium chrysogenum]
MALIGHVFNRVLNKYIPVYIAESGNGFIRLTAYIDQKVKDAAFATVKAPFENGKLFKDDDMKQMEQLSITNMSHSSLGDTNAHYSVQGETGAGSKVKGNHAQEDQSKQTVIPAPPLHVGINAQLIPSL